MRTLEINKIGLWLVGKQTEVDVVDEDGFNTGEVKSEYGVPKDIRLQLYPATGDVVEHMFGKDVECDMVTVSTDIVLKKDDLLFLSQPSGDYGKTYDYKVSHILKSLNGYNYGLKGRIGNG